jgi:hypothetical protein
VGRSGGLLSKMERGKRLLPWQRERRLTAVLAATAI